MFNCCAGRIEKSLRNRGKQPIQLFFLSRFCLRIHPVRGRRRRGLDFYPRMGSGEWRYFSPLRPPRGEPPTSLARGRAQPREEEKGGKMQKYCQRALRLLRPLAFAHNRDSPTVVTPPPTFLFGQSPPPRKECLRGPFFFFLPLPFISRISL